MSILWTILIGFIAGVLAKLITPGSNEPQASLLTILGIVGAFVATYLGQSLGWYQADQGAGLIWCDGWGSDRAAGLGRSDPFAQRSLSVSISELDRHVMPDKLRKTASDLKLMIEEKLRAGHPDCERAEVIINPPAAGRPWSAAIFGQGPAIPEIPARLESIVEQLHDPFDLA